MKNHILASFNSFIVAPYGILNNFAKRLEQYIYFLLYLKNYFFSNNLVRIFCLNYSKIKSLSRKDVINCKIIVRILFNATLNIYIFIKFNINTYFFSIVSVAFVHVCNQKRCDRVVYCNILVFSKGINIKGTK